MSGILCWGLGHEGDVAALGTGSLSMPCFLQPSISVDSVQSTDYCVYDVQNFIPRTLIRIDFPSGYRHYLWIRALFADGICITSDKRTFKPTADFLGE